jgi:hypothetical protein
MILMITRWQITLMWLSSSRKLFPSDVQYPLLRLVQSSTFPFTTEDWYICPAVLMHDFLCELASHLLLTHQASTGNNICDLPFHIQR